MSCVHGIVWLQYQGISDVLLSSDSCVHYLSWFFAPTACLLACLPFVGLRLYIVL
jgi:hypothetical protein